MAVLLTGVGYIGSALAARLLAEGFDVVAVENFFSTPRPAVLRLAVSEHFTLVEGSITDPEVIRRAFDTAEVDTVYHLAAQASTDPSAAPTSYTIETNFLGTWRMLDASVARGVRRVVLASSTRLYRPPLPVRVNERTPLHARDLVHLSHRFGEVLMATTLRGPNAPTTGIAARIGITYGMSPVMKTDPRFLPAPQRFCLQAARGEPLTVATGAAAVLPIVHVDDAVEGLLCCRRYAGPATAVNIASEVRSMASVAEAVRAAAATRGIETAIRLVGRARSFRPREIRSALASAGFAPFRRLEDTIGDVIDYYRQAVTEA